MRILNDILVHKGPFNMWNSSIVLCYRGSLAHGTYRAGQYDDKDVFGIALPPPEWFFSLKTFEQFEMKFHMWDVLIYDFRKFIRLLMKANPNVLSALWTPDDTILRDTDVFRELVKERNIFSSKRIYKSFCGYSQAQLHKMEHTAYKGYMGEKRKALVDQFGYDCKNAAHLIRLQRQGTEFLETGELKVRRNDADQLIQIKTGQWSIEKVKKEAEKGFIRMENAYKRSTLPDDIDEEKINEMVFVILRNYYK